MIETGGQTWWPVTNRSCYIVGFSGAGKSALMFNLCKELMAQGHGVGFIDPHGDEIENLLTVIPKERKQDVVLFDLTRYTPGLNLVPHHDNVLRTPAHRRHV